MAVNTITGTTGNDLLQGQRLSGSNNLISGLADADTWSLQLSLTQSAAVRAMTPSHLVPASPSMVLKLLVALVLTASMQMAPPF